jgi:glyoxylase-like metal-dependent hydrolase (beta-lactamase superfamily II)
MPVTFFYDNSHLSKMKGELPLARYFSTSSHIHLSRKFQTHLFMKVEQIYTGCIAHAAYYLESNGEAAIFDPLREVQPYIDRAAKDNAIIKYVFLTHFHADFVSGHLDLAKKTGAQIVYGPTAKPSYKIIAAKDNQVFRSFTHPATPWRAPHICS